MYTPPKALVRAIKNYDPTLRVRFHKATQRWGIEVPMPRRHPEFLRIAKPPAHLDTLSAKIAFDRYEAMQESYFPVFTVPRDQGHHVEAILEGLHAHDAAAQGGMARINDALDAAQELWQAEQDKARRTYVEERAASMADSLSWLGGHTVATPLTAQEPMVSDTVEAHDGFSVRTRRGLHRSVA